ncbi:SAM-dependent methyltransferase [Phormidium sp. LEGE 05292]|nr:SAM-dependent methyltransferase [Phormidium sp. LEGE 05292]
MFSDDRTQKAISHTALIVAAKRAIENQRSDRLFEDPFAALLAADEIPILLERWQKVGDNLAQITAKRTRFIAVRTRFYDDFLMSAQLGVSQVVILGAGMDARAFRLPWHNGTRVYEIDRPEVLQYKDSILQDVPAKCFRTVIKADLTDNWVDTLLSQGFCVTHPSIWLLEGVLMYLPQIAVFKLLQKISELSVDGSFLGADFVSVKSVEVGEKARQSDRGRVLRHWQFGCDRPEDLLLNYGWDATVIQPGENGANFGRYSEHQPSRDIPGTRQVFLVTAKKNSPVIFRQNHEMKVFSR